MKRNNTIVQFFRCFGCGRTRFIEDIENGLNCPRCGGWHVTYANPTLFSVIELFCRFPKYIKIFIRENILAR